MTPAQVNGMIVVFHASTLPLFLVLHVQHYHTYGQLHNNLSRYNNNYYSASASAAFVYSFYTRVITGMDPGYINFIDGGGGGGSIASQGIVIADVQRNDAVSDHSIQAAIEHIYIAS